MYNYSEIESEALEYIDVASTSELPNGERLMLSVDGESIAVFNIAGSYYAISDVCSHDDGPVAEGELSEFELECPRHGARFDLRTGEALTLPAVVDIPAYPVRVVGDRIQVGMPAED